jgi:hypothetical protein
MAMERIKALSGLSAPTRQPALPAATLPAEEEGREHRLSGREPFLGLNGYVFEQVAAESPPFESPHPSAGAAAATRPAGGRG